MSAIRKKSISITGYLERLLNVVEAKCRNEDIPSFEIITPIAPDQRGAQLSVKLQPRILDRVLAYLADNGVVIDERKPDVIRVAPAPLYNTYEDVWQFCQVFHDALVKCHRGAPAAANGDRGISKSGN